MNEHELEQVAVDFRSMADEFRKAAFRRDVNRLAGRIGENRVVLGARPGYRQLLEDAEAWERAADNAERLAERASE